MSRGGNRLRYDSVDGSGLTSSNVIRLESSKSRENGEAKYLGDLIGREWYIMDKPLPQTLLDGSSSEERETFERWHANQHKVRSIILASMSNDVQKQYDRLDDVSSILQRMKEVYAIPNRHTRYVATKGFFRAKMTKRSSVQEHVVKMLSLVEKLEDLKAGLENDTYIDVILQSLPPSHDPFIVNFNMNGLEKSINE
ncbi:UNVERIFIED_CONTAM: hypothetical protein Scaly_3024200 [Sesamum calycinum]|uniref:Uncharacterized protein n=1 Tax=Sesamum calycinum TaxID=2727403 RepID=A0AAW2K837_9LAMI